jgi:D-alanyl-D-alanine carboxypeptidase (penicillin-binding protein 5/6)
MHKLLLFIFSVFILVSINVKSAEAISSSAKQAIMVDFETGMVLFEKNADERMPTSSMSKVLTAYLVFEALKDESLDLNDTFKVSKKAWKKGGSKMFVEVDKRVSIEDLLRGVIIQSGNDATIVLAEGLHGSEEAFARAMNLKSSELGMKNSHFANASGWPHPEHYSTARDLAILADHLIRDFPEYYHYYSETEYTYNNITQRNRNPLLFRDIGADGIKTGHTEEGGFGLIGSGQLDGRRVIVVLNGLEDEKARAQESARLLEWGLKGFENLTLFKNNETIDYAHVIMGKKEKIPMVIKTDLLISVPINVKNDLKVNISYNEPLLAPIRKGDQIGSMKVQIPRIKEIDIPLYAGESVESLGFFATTLEKVKLFISNGNYSNTQ